MKYIIIGALLAIGWNFVEIIYEIIREIVFNILHKTKWYLIACGRTPKNVNGMDSEKVKNPIGFYQSKERS